MIVMLAALVSSSGHAGSLPPQGKKALLAWLRAGSYQRTFVPELEPHPSVPAHGRDVRTWYSTGLVDDLRSGRTTFRRGAAMVKELYLDGPDAPPVGWAVMRKLQSRSGSSGRGWFFYETFDGSKQGAARGRGVPVCVGCHRNGTDYLLSPFRP